MQIFAKILEYKEGLRELEKYKLLTMYLVIFTRIIKMMIIKFLNCRKWEVLPILKKETYGQHKKKQRRC